MKENTQPTVFVAGICELLRQQGFHAYARTMDIPDSLIKKLGTERNILDDDIEKSVSDFSSSELRKELESRGFQILDDDEEYNDEVVRQELSKLYFKRIAGHSIEEELNTLIMIAANRIV